MALGEADRIDALNEKEELFCIVRDFGELEIVSTGVVLVMEVGGTGKISRCGLAEVVEEGGLNGGPLVEGTGDAEGAGGGWGRQSRCALEAAHIGNELEVVIVAVTAAHRFDIAAELMVELVHKDEGSSGGAPASGDPFVPTGDEDEGGLERVGAFPLFLEVVAFIRRAWGDLLLTGFETAPAGIAKAHVGDLAVAGAEVLSGGYGDLLGLGGVVFEAVGLGVGGFPVPGLEGVGHVERPMSAAEREEIADGSGGFRGVAEEQGFAVPVKPEFGELGWGVEFVVDLEGGVAGAGIDHERDLGCVSPSLADLAEDAAEGEVDIAVGECVGGIEDEDIDASVGEEEGVAAEDPGVVAEVIAIKRFAPVVVDADAAPEGGIGALEGVGSELEDFGDVVRAVEAGGPFGHGRLVPEEVEHADEAIGGGGADFRVEGKGTAEVVHGGPGGGGKRPWGAGGLGDRCEEEGEEEGGGGFHAC